MNQTRIGIGTQGFQKTTKSKNLGSNDLNRSNSSAPQHSRRIDLSNQLISSELDCARKQLQEIRLHALFVFRFPESSRNKLQQFHSGELFIPIKIRLYPPDNTWEVFPIISSIREERYQFFLLLITLDRVKIAIDPCSCYIPEGLNDALSARLAVDSNEIDNEMIEQRCLPENYVGKQ